MAWQGYLLLSILFLSLNSLFHRSLMKEDNSDPILQAIVFLTIGGLISLLIAYFRGKLSFSIPSVVYLILFLFSIVSAIAYSLKYSGYKLLGASEVVILASTSKLWNVFGASLFLNEDLSAQKILGTVVILVGVCIVMFKNREFKINRSVIAILLSALFFAVADILGYKVLKTVDASIFQIYFYFLPVLALLIYSPKIIFKIKYYFKFSRATRVILLSIFDTLGMLFLFFAYQNGGQASIIAPLSAIKIIVTVILAMLFLRENDNKLNKVLGSAVATVGVMLLL